MNSMHDMGGMHGFGSVERETDEPVFHHEWEGKVLALARISMAGGHFNLDCVPIIHDPGRVFTSWD